MVILLWDASALAKRYSLETGTDSVDALFALVPANQMVATFLGYAETYWTLLHKRNRGDITGPTFRAAVSLMQAEVLDSVDFGMLSLDDTAILGGIEYIERYNLNSSDAAILVAFQGYAQAEAAVGGSCVLVAADQRLLHAAQVEGLATVNPELLPVADVAAFLASL
jgi:predicted nucleic acid-binding protein